MKQVNVLLPDELYKRIKKSAIDSGIPLKKIIEDAIDTYLFHLYEVKDDGIVDTKLKKATPVKVPPARVVRSNKGNMDFIL